MKRTWNRQRGEYDSYQRNDSNDFRRRRPRRTPFFSQTHCVEGQNKAFNRMSQSGSNTVRNRKSTVKQSENVQTPSTSNEDSQENKELGIHPFCICIYLCHTTINPYRTVGVYWPCQWSILFLVGQKWTVLVTWKVAFLVQESSPAQKNIPVCSRHILTDLFECVFKDTFFWHFMKTYTKRRVKFYSNIFWRYKDLFWLTYKYATFVSFGLIPTLIFCHVYPVLSGLTLKLKQLSSRRFSSELIEASKTFTNLPSNWRKTIIMKTQGNNLWPTSISQASYFQRMSTSR